MGASYVDLPIHIECPKWGAKNMRTNDSCSSCDASLVEVKEKLMQEIAKSRGSTHQADPFAGEKRVGLIPRVRTFQFTGLGHRVMEGTIVLTDMRLLFAAHKAGSVKSVWGIAGSKGGILGTIASAGSIKMRVGGPDDVNLSPDQLLRAYDGNFQIPYDVVVRAEGEDKRNSLVLSLATKGIHPFTPGKADLTFLLPDELRERVRADGTDKDQAWRDYCQTCRNTLERTLLGAGIAIAWKN